MGKTKGQPRSEKGVFQTRLDDKTRKIIKKMLRRHARIGEMMGYLRKTHPDIKSESTLYSWILQSEGDI